MICFSRRHGWNGVCSVVNAFMGVKVSGIAVFSLIFASTGIMAVGIVGKATPAAAQGSCMQPGEISKPIPWAQRFLMPERVWPLTTGAGVTIAVLDSGVDARHPQLGGKILPGQDFLYAKGGPGNKDCVGHGTAVASVIVAKQVEETGFRGIAPNASILPVVVSEKEGDDKQGQSASGSSVTPDDFAKALRWAVTQKVKIINLSLAFKVDHRVVREAVNYAVANDVVVVAAAGNYGADGNPTPYPAAYDDVLAVGAVGPNGVLLPESGRGPFIDLVAPGDGIVAATPERGHAAWKGTSFAAPFVSATAALVRQYYPQLTAKQVMERILATASPVPGGPSGTQYGKGIVDPYRAVIERLPTSSPSAGPRGLTHSVRAGTASDSGESDSLIRASMLIASASAGFAFCGLGAIVVRRRGRRQGWRPTRAAPSSEDRDDRETSAQLFEEFP